MHKEFYNFLTRTDHPAFRKHYNEVNTDSFNSILNHILAKQLEKLDRLTQIDYLNNFPHLVDEDEIGDWENQYFGFVKNGKTLEVRRAELLKWLNSDIRMSLPDVVAAAESLVGKTPEVIVNANKGNFVLGSNKLGRTTILAGEDTPANRQTYIVRFSVNIPNSLLRKLDAELTRIEKGGSKHIISSPPLRWILGESALGVDTFIR